MGQKEEEEGEQVKKIKPSKVNQRNMCLCINIKKSLYELGKKRKKLPEREKSERIPKRSRVDCLLGCVIKSNSQSCQSSFLLIHFLLFSFAPVLFFLLEYRCVTLLWKTACKRIYNPPTTRNRSTHTKEREEKKGNIPDYSLLCPAIFIELFFPPFFSFLSFMGLKRGTV
jgi:hypothetical protein